MQKQSAYTKTSGYPCQAIQAQMNNVNRKRAILDQHQDPLKDRVLDGHIHFVDVARETKARSSYSTLNGLVEMHRVPTVKKQNLQPPQTGTNARYVQGLPLKNQNLRKSTNSHVSNIPKN